MSMIKGGYSGVTKFAGKLFGAGEERPRYIEDDEDPFKANVKKAKAKRINNALIEGMSESEEEKMFVEEKIPAAKPLPL